jgi:hypothetical protein
VLVGVKIDEDTTEQRAANTDLPAAWRDDAILANISLTVVLVVVDG